MHVIYSPDLWHVIRQKLRSYPSYSIGFIPTMGNLHKGHTSLIKRSVKKNTVTVLSIFVNSTQFDDPSDALSYPKTLEQDLAIAEKEKVDYVLVLEHNAVYPDNYTYRISEHSDLGNSLEGEKRPGHFTGMLTVVLKLLILVQPSNVYFGAKDYQQYLLVKNMIMAFFLDINIVLCPTVREPTGLACSSRNQRLSPEDQNTASMFSHLLLSNIPNEEIVKQLHKHGFEVDYVENKWGRRLGAVRFKGVRLIDNFQIDDTALPQL
ncbi:pantoate--beta-alanine ligase [Rickettsiales endosymbiont of Peranema trichophorum]|uniref:pantoate--beta-alanine ligase n=1 Tax=Rickettsiales endosymbiont of Peranema trichophorum TaxID=2486577 RepID=UPI001023023E|nr:pantoate--beta-alanine ligase [Rickettsiales endosymbiont of Peranema trichophorum]RZI47731.1 pantoate--beta-alanine ligase [Rickettsiales endosymbiont of Peranema trichophorum]